METIRKIISLEDAMSRVCGGLPFYEFNGDNTRITSGINGNYGGFVCDVSGYSFTCETLSGETTWSGNTEGVIRTRNVMRRYNTLLDILRNSEHILHLKNNSCENTDEYENKFVTKFEYSGTTYDFIREAKPLKKSDFEYVNDAYTYNGDEGDIEDVEYVIMISDEDLDTYNNYLGIEFVKQVDELYLTSGETTFSDDELIVPYISVPVLLTSEFSDIGVVSNYLDDTYSAISFSKDLVQFSSLTETYNIESWKLQPSSVSFTEDDDIEIETKLQSLRIPKYFTDDTARVLEGIFQDFEGATGDTKGKFFKCIFYDKESKTREIYHYSAITFWWSINGYYEDYESVPYTINSDIVYMVGPIRENFREEITQNGTGTTTLFGIDYTYTGYTRERWYKHYKWWEVIPYDGEPNDLLCADDEEVEPNEEKYRTLTVFEVLKKQITDPRETALNDEDYFYYLVKYNNGMYGQYENGVYVGEIYSMVIPYEVGMVFNKDNKDDVYTGDYLISSSVTQYTGSTPGEVKNIITFTYNMGATFSDSAYTTVTEDGTICQESYIIEYGKLGTMNIDNYEDVNYWYDNIIYDDNLVRVYSEDLNLYRETTLAKVDSMKTADVWRTDGSVLNTQTFKKDYLMGISMDYNTDINVEINRGNAAAFEKHFKLAECNTFQDLEDMGNNFFNL